MNRRFGNLQGSVGADAIVQDCQRTDDFQDRRICRRNRGSPCCCERLVAEFDVRGQWIEMPAVVVGIDRFAGPLGLIAEEFELG